MFNVITCVCKPTGELFVAVRKDSLRKYTNRTRVSAFAPSSTMTAHLRSVAEHGIENHVFRLVGEFDTKAEANTLKVAILATRGLRTDLMCVQVPRAGVPEAWEDVGLSTTAITRITRTGAETPAELVLRDRDELAAS